MFLHSRKYHNKHSTGGFTLLESLLYIALSAIILLVAFSVLFFINRSKAKFEAVTSIDNEANFVISHILRHVQGAATIDTPSPGTSDGGFSLSFVSPTSFSETYSIIDNRLMVSHDGNTFPLTSDRVRISDFVVERLTSSIPTSGLRISFLISTEATAPQDSFYAEKQIVFSVQQR